MVYMNLTKLYCICAILFLCCGCYYDQEKLWEEMYERGQCSKYMSQGTAVRPKIQSQKAVFSTIIHFRPNTPDNIVVKAAFENPVIKDYPIVIVKKYPTAPKSILLETYPIFGIKQHHNYYVDISLFTADNLELPIDHIYQVFDTYNVGSDLNGNLIMDI